MRIFVLLVTCLLFALHVSGQENNSQARITLKTGDVYVGMIVLKTADMIMLTTKEGARYQFQLTEIAKTESDTEPVVTEPKKQGEVIRQTKSSFGGLVECSVGVSNAKYSFGWAPNTQFSLLFGNKDLLDGSLFVGVGAGYNGTFVASGAQTIGFLPLFVRLQSRLSKQRTAPYVGMDGGYAVALNKNYGGGVLIKISAGITHRISYKSSLIVGVYAGVQSFSGPLTETNELGTYSYNGKTTMNSVGAKVGLMF